MESNLPPLISYIVPAYNVAPYVQACLESIYAVDMGAYSREVIVCDDGSADGTAQVLQSCRERHPDLVVLSQPNSGVSAARNNCLRVARGKYICFVDSDDMLNAQQASRFPFRCLEQEDIDIYGVDMQVHTHRGTFPYRRYTPQYNRIYRPARSFMEGRNLIPCPCAYLCRREFIVQHGLSFHEGICHEDEEWSILLFAQAESFVAIRNNFYTYCLRRDSITTTTDRARQQSHLRNVLQVLTTIDGYLRAHPECRASMSYKVNYICVDLLRLLLRQHHPRAFRQEIISGLRRLGYFPLPHQRGIKYRMFRLFTKYCF